MLSTYRYSCHKSGLEYTDVTFTSFLYLTGLVGECERRGVTYGHPVWQRRYLCNVNVKLYILNISKIIRLTFKLDKDLIKQEVIQLAQYIIWLPFSKHSLQSGNVKSCHVFVHFFSLRVIFFLFCMIHQTMIANTKYFVTRPYWECGSLYY